MPYEDEFFDIVMQFAVFTSIFDEKMKRRIASEMLRVLESDGIILWYDYFISKPTNPDTKGVRRREIKRRLLAPYSWLVSYLLEKIPWLNTHYLVVIRRRKK